MITLAVKGVPYATYESINVKKSMDTLSGTFSFQAVNADDAPFPISVDDECEIKIDDNTIIKGRVEVINGNFDDKGHTLSVSGRDKTADVVESTIGGNIQFSTPISMENVIKQTLAKCGIQGVGVVNKVKNLKDFSKSDIVSAKIGDTVFEFLEKYARKRQVLLTSDGQSNIVITRTSDIKATETLINKLDNNDNNIKSGSFNYDISKRFNKYVFWSQGNPVSANNSDYNIIANYKAMATVKSSFTDSQIHQGKTLNKMAEQSSDSGDLSDRADWEGNLRKARSFTYTAVVQGYKMADGNIWDTNLIFKVVDQFAGINSELLLNSVEFNLTNDGGSTTSLSFIRPDAYTIQEKIDALKDKNKAKVTLKYDPNAKVSLNQDDKE